MSTIFVPRVFGGTLILTIAPPQASITPVVVVVTFRDGATTTTFRDGVTNTTFRDGVAQVGGR